MAENVPSVMTLNQVEEKEFLDKIEYRLRHRNISLSERKDIATSVWQGQLEIADVPSLGEVLSMEMAELVNALEKCPESEWFYRDSEGIKISEQTYDYVQSQMIKIVA